MTYKQIDKFLNHGNLYQSIGATYSANQVVGKTLIAKREIPIKRLPYPNAPTVFTVQKGQNVGVVYSWIDPRAQTGGKLWWSYNDANGKPYYTEHNPNWYDVKALKDQGALDVVEVRKQEEEANKSPFEKLNETASTVRSVSRTVQLMLGIGVAIWAISRFGGGNRRREEIVIVQNRRRRR